MQRALIAGVSVVCLNIVRSSSWWLPPAILVDGVPVHNAGGAYDFSDLMADAIERHRGRFSGAAAMAASVGRQLYFSGD